MDAGDAVTDLDDLADAARAQFGAELLDLLANDGTDFFRFDVHDIPHGFGGGRCALSAHRLAQSFQRAVRAGVDDAVAHRHHQAGNQVRVDLPA